MAYANEVLVSTDWVAEHRTDGDVVVAEVDENTALYDEGHIPGSVRLHWKDEMQQQVVRDVIPRDEFEQLLSSKGIGNDTTVVLYGDKNNWFAAYAYWYLKLYGHENVRIIDGGRQKWIDEGRELTTEQPASVKARYSAKEIDTTLRSRREDVLRIVNNGAEQVLVDVRSPQEYSGELIAMPGYEQEGAQRGGHIPRAQSIPWAQAVKEDGTFKSADDLKALYEAKGVTPNRPVTAYCRIGERSSHTWFVLRELLGYPDVRNYDGSWTEWGNLVDVPIVKGPNPS
jgi:thiosulfate/3-mercaptopyruvate sulfurtransferase